MSTTSLGVNALLMSEVSEEWPDWFKLIGRQQRFEYSLIRSKVCRRASLTVEHIKCSSSRRPHHVPLLSAKNRKLRVQFSRAHQNWTTEGEMLPGPMSLHVYFNIQIAQPEFGVNMKACCFISTAVAGSWRCDVWGIFYLHTLDPLPANEYYVNTTAFPSVVVDNVHSFTTTERIIVWWMLPGG